MTLSLPRYNIFLVLLQTTLNVVNPSRHVFFPCQLCSSESFRWQFDLYKHYATQHFAEELMGMLNLGGGTGGCGDTNGGAGSSPFKCPWPGCSLVLDTEQQIVRWSRRSPVSAPTCSPYPQHTSKTSFSLLHCFVQ